MMMEAVRISETSFYFYETARRYAQKAAMFKYTSNSLRILPHPYFTKDRKIFGI
jgi:hypothetical protein